eukprot:1157298-Pelagomonas_calceolata.AAC.27
MYQEAGPDHHHAEVAHHEPLRSQKKKKRKHCTCHKGLQAVKQAPVPSKLARVLTIWSGRITGALHK